MGKVIFAAVISAALTLFATDRAEDNAGSFEMKMPVLTVNSVTGGHCDWLPMQYSRKPSGDALRVLIADDTPGGSGEMIRGCVWMAATTAAMLKNDPLNGVRLTIEFSGDVDGPSAGGITCLAILLAMERKEVPGDFAMTGTIMPDGTIGLVGGVAKKIRGAALKGVKRVCIPAFLRWEKQDDGSYVDLFTCCEDAGVKVYPIRTVEEAYKIVTGCEFRVREMLHEREILALPKEVDQAIIAEVGDIAGGEPEAEVVKMAGELADAQERTGFIGYTDWWARCCGDLDAFKRGKMLTAFHRMQYWESVFCDGGMDKLMSVWNGLFEITNYPFTAISETYKVGTNQYNNIRRFDAGYYAGTSEEKQKKDAAEMRRLVKMLTKVVLDETSGSSSSDDDTGNLNDDFPRGYYPDGDTTDIAAQSEDFDRIPEAAGYFKYYNSYVRLDKDYTEEGIENLGGPEARDAALTLLNLRYKIWRFRNNCASKLSCTNRCLIYSKLPAMKIERSDAEKVASFFFVSTRSILGVIQTALKEETERANVLMSDYEDWITSKDPHYPVLTTAHYLAVKRRMESAQGKVRDPDYNLSAMIYLGSQVMARACALQVKYTPDMEYDFVKDKIGNKGFAYFLIRLARTSALEAIAGCRKRGIPCIDPMLRFELADEAMGETQPDLIHDVLENYWRAYFGAKALYMGFRNGTVLKDRLADDLEKADGGDAEAQNEMGKRYLSGNGVAKDYDRAYAWFQKSAAKGNAKAMNNLGVCHMNGWGVEADAKAGCEYFEKAAELGLAMAQVKVGKMWLNGFTFKGGYAVTNDVKRGFEWLRKAALQKDPEAAFQMWRCYEEGIAVQKDSRKALEWLNSAVELNHSDAQFKLAEKYEYGNGCEKDIVKAYKLFQESAKQGNSKALNSLGLWYQRGTFVAKDYRKAAELFSKSAKQGDHWGEYMMAVCYESGSGVKMDYAKAAELMVKAAKCDFAPSMVGLARYYEKGIGVQKDKVEALKWYVKAVQNENIYDEQKKEAQLAIERLEPNAKKMQSDASKK